MKKFGYMILALVMIIACNVPPQPKMAATELSPQPTHLVVPDTPEPATVDTQPPPTEISVVQQELVEKAYKEESVSPAYTLEISFPDLQDSSQSAVFNALVDNLIKENVDEFIIHVNENEPIRLEYHPDMTSNLIVYHNVTLADENIISVFFNFSPYIAGAAHPSQYGHVVNFDMQRGVPLKLADLFLPDADYLTPIAAYCRDELEERVMLFPEGVEPVEANFLNWNISPDHLSIHFDLYQVAPYTGGAPEVSIPFAQLQGILDPAGPLTPYLQ